MKIDLERKNHKKKKRNIMPMFGGIVLIVRTDIYEARQSDNKHPSFADKDT